MKTLAWTTLQETNAEHLWSGSRWQKAWAGDSLSILQKPWKTGIFPWARKSIDKYPLYTPEI